jgi:hypothetical protein
VIYAVLSIKKLMQKYPTSDKESLSSQEQERRSTKKLLVGHMARQRQTA